MLLFGSCVVVEMNIPAYIAISLALIILSNPVYLLLITHVSYCTNVFSLIIYSNFKTDYYSGNLYMCFLLFTLILQ